jgi:alpha-beta hydrolase superfamily lysophospholipase
MYAFAAQPDRGDRRYPPRPTMPHEEDRFEVADGLTLYENRWYPDGEAAAVVVLVHGFAEHSGRYRRVADALGQRGYAVYAMDLRGHGKSDGPRVFVASFDLYLDDLKVYLARVRRREPQKPTFLFGHSMGGAIVCRLAMTDPPGVNGLVLSAPAIQMPDNLFPLLRRLASPFSRLFPWLRVVKLGSSMLSRDVLVLARFEQDPLVFHGRLPARTGAEILRAVEQIQSNMEALRLPFLILQGTGDRVVDPEGARALYERAAAADKTLKLYEGLYHEVLSEPEKEQVTADMLAWLDARR